MINTFWYNLNAINAGIIRPKGLKNTLQKVGVFRQQRSWNFMLQPFQAWVVKRRVSIKRQKKENLIELIGKKKIKRQD